MNKIIQANFLKRRASMSLLGLTLDGNRLEGVVLRCSNGSLQVNQRFAATLSLDPLTNEPELVGREILNHLEAAGVRERRCVVAVPLKWALAAHTKIPELPEADVAGFLQIEAERGFPTDLATLQVATSRLVSASGEKHVTFVGVPKVHAERLERVLRAAKLKPSSFSLGITALQPARTEVSEGVLALVFGEHYVGLQITCGGGVAALRALEGTTETENGARVLHGELIAREARITLGQLSADLRESVKLIRIFGSGEQIRELADEIRSRFEPRGLKVELVTTYPANAFGKTIPPETPVSAAFSLSARKLTGRSDPFEFLPPKVSAWERTTSKYAPGRLRKVISSAAAVLVVVIGLFGFQQWQLALLRSQWKAMSPKVRELTGVQAQIQQYRPWFDESFRYLGIMRDLANAFTADGSVTAKTLGVRDLGEGRNAAETRGMNAVNCSGNAENYAAVVTTIHKLGAISGVTNFNYQIRGKTPMQFTFDFQMSRGPR
jgi:uncharacterized protein